MTGIDTKVCKRIQNDKIGLKKAQKLKKAQNLKKESPL